MIDIRWARAAREDLAAIDDHYRAIDPDLAARIGRSILSAAAFLQDLPRAGPIAVMGDRRKWRVPGTPYLLFYRITENHVRILRVLHTARDHSRP